MGPDGVYLRLLLQTDSREAKKGVRITVYNSTARSDEVIPGCGSDLHEGLEQCSVNRKENGRWPSGGCITSRAVNITALGASWVDLSSFYIPSLRSPTLIYPPQNVRRVTSQHVGWGATEYLRGETLRCGEVRLESVSTGLSE